MAKVAIKSEKLSPFGGIFPIPQIRNYAPNMIQKRK